jgi:hypothetical protein
LLFFRLKIEHGCGTLATPGGGNQTIRNKLAISEDKSDQIAI